MTDWYRKIQDEYHDFLFEYDILQNMLYRANELETIDRLEDIFDEIQEVMKKYYESK